MEARIKSSGKSPRFVVNIAGSFVGAIAIVSSLSAAAQSAGDVDVVFEVASVKPNRTVGALSGYRVAPGGLYTGTSLRPVDLVLEAYNIMRFQLVGAPPWMTSERFDVVARATGELTSSGAHPTLPGALRVLLRDRFSLMAHEEFRELPTYVLKIKRNGRLGSNLAKAEIDCATLPLTERKPNDCRVSAPGARGRYFAASVPISTLVGILTPFVGRPVVDRTGLEGNFRIDLTWDPLETPRSLSALAREPTSGLSIFDAVEEQLGLKLEPSSEPIRMIVIDKVDRPSGN